MDLLEGIYTRRSIRQYTDQPVEREQIIEIIRARIWDPSGLNNQPWRFVLGEILKSASAVRMFVGLPEEMKIMAVITIGHPLQQRRTSRRKDVPEVLLKEL